MSHKTFKDFDLANEYAKKVSTENRATVKISRNNGCWIVHFLDEKQCQVGAETNCLDSYELEELENQEGGWRCGFSTYLDSLR